MTELYALDILEQTGPRCPHCGTKVITGGSWKRLGTRKTRRGIVALANRSLSTGFSFRIQAKDEIRGWCNDSMRGVKGYGL